MLTKLAMQEYEGHGLLLVWPSTAQCPLFQPHFPQYIRQKQKGPHSRQAILKKPSAMA